MMGIDCVPTTCVCACTHTNTQLHTCIYSHVYPHTTIHTCVCTHTHMTLGCPGGLSHHLSQQPHELSALASHSIGEETEA